MRLAYDSYQAPFGLIRIIMDQEGLKGVALTSEHWQECLAELGEIGRDQFGCSPAITQLDEYFCGKRRKFDIPFSTLKGGDFSKTVWRGLMAIPYGETRTYTEIAQAIGNPKAIRAVGQANRRNPLPIFIPCHRVIGKNGELTGYIGKGYLGIKQYLLEMEKSFGGLLK